MLQDLGDKLKGSAGSGGKSRWIGYLILGALILVFVAWGPYAAVDLSFTQGDYAAKVGGEKIPATEINERWQQRLPQLLQAAGGQLSEEQRVQLQNELLDSAVTALAATQHARKLGLRVSDAQVEQAFRETPAFQVDGKFSATAARSMLASSGLSVQAYEADIRNSLLTEQLQATIAATDFLTPGETRRLLALLDEEREVRFALLQPEAFAGNAPVDAAAIEAYYKANAAQFAVPESVKLDYAELALPDLAASLTVGEAQLRERYEKDKGLYVQPETRRARHILIAVDDTTDDAKAAAQAQDLHDRIRAGGDFAALARQFSKDTASAEQGGDLGWSGRDVYEGVAKEFADRLFAMKEGEVGEPLKTQFGYHIIKLEGIRAGAGRSFEDVRAEIAATLRSELAGQEFTTREDQLQEKLEQGTTSLDTLVKEYGLTRGTVERFERGAGGLPLGSDAELNRLVFSDAALNQRRVAGPVQLGEDRITLIQVVSHTPASTKSLAEVKDTITAAIRRERGAAAAKVAADAAVARLKTGEKLDAVLSGLKVKSDPARFVARSAPDLPVQLRDAAFAGLRPTADKPHVEAVTLDGGAVALLAVTGSRVQSLTEDPQLQQLRAQRELQRYSVRDLDAYVGDIVSATKVRKNPQAFLQ
jgi:peptidyl-prolyl cis-trans isomerase D